MKHSLTLLMLSLGMVTTAAHAALDNHSQHATTSVTVSTSNSYISMPVPTLQATAKSGDKAAQFFLASRYKLGQGVNKDLAQAFKWFEKSAEQGVSAAQLNVGQMYAEGRGTKVDLNQAKLWLQKAAKQGDNRASYNLALLEERSKNLSSAYQWYDLAAREGMLDRNVTKQAQGKIIKLAANLSQQDMLAARARADRWFQDEQ